ncbi:ATP-binding protein [Vibrio sp. IRLE0018]|uniref:hybrid sensor histidine kinase/response regulator n=1 Tax=Vibrio floridensis TaxID=2908007 RepID=UPI001F2ADF2F|nr:hybrid sensor histidine kinase/response regulator [Vibrio floridensis]MCF8778148.1 ATP-binding protein [Vibrio floridensis]
MKIRSSLRKKSIYALSLYLCFFIATLGSITYWVVEPPVRDSVQKNLDLRAELLASQIKSPFNRSIGVLNSLVGIAQSQSNETLQPQLIARVLSTSDAVIASGGVWPHPEQKDGKLRYTSLFFNKGENGEVERIHSYNNPESIGYHKESWYRSVSHLTANSIVWSNVYTDAYTQVQMITASQPYFIDGEFAGVATVDISLESLFELLKNYTEEYQLGVSISDSADRLLLEHAYTLQRGRYISEINISEINWELRVLNAKLLVSDEVFQQVMRVEAGILPFLLICVLAGYYLLNRYVITPIVAIAKKIDVSKTGGIIDIHYESEDEIKHLIETINEKTIYLEAEKVKAQASTNAKTAFLATLSHEIRTPMNGVLGTAQILLKTPLNEEQRKHLKTLYDSGDHMMTLLNEILDYSKIEQGHMEFDNNPFPFDSIIGSINSVYFTLCAEKGLQFKVYSKVPNGRWYNADKARLRQVLFNLLNNAVKFTDRGLVEVYLEEHQREDVNYLSVKVKDTGIGIPESAQKRIFRPFEQAESTTTRRFGGTGLGLAIVKQIAEKMKGYIEVSSQVGLGTCFTVELQLDTTSPSVMSNEPRYKLNYQGLHALIVEDNRTNAIIIETFLRHKGFSCEKVENGEQAIARISEQAFDLILMDNHMPVMDGIEAITAIRAMDSKSKRSLIFGCTADVFKETRERMLGVGADHIIAKPIVESELDDALFQHAKLLYQFRPEALGQHYEEPVTADDSLESLLLGFHIALENVDLKQANRALQRIKEQLSASDNELLLTTLDHIQASLEQDIPPEQDAVNQITVLLGQYP